MMRFLFSAIIPSTVFGGERGGSRCWPDAECADEKEGADACIDVRRDAGSRNGFGIAVRFFGSAVVAVAVTVAGVGIDMGVADPRTPNLLGGLVAPGPIETDRDRCAAKRSKLDRPGESSSGSRLTRSD